jgi:protein O-mannosyl-transferase
MNRLPPPLGANNLSFGILRSPTVLSLILIAGTLILYVPALNSAFVNYDDPAYVTANAHVLHGLSWSNLVWAFTATTEANWHPLTWISHMADVQLFGLNPRGHHLSSVLLHAFNVVLLFLILRTTTGCLLRSAVVAGLFAVHPLNVECVAWVAERKSVLSMSCLLLALVAYTGYARQRKPGRYAVVAVVFALGLASKPMVVTFPLLLLLWDYWPLRRTASGPGDSSPRRSSLRLVAEKIPLLAMSAASSWITLYSERRGGALGAAELLPLGSRIENALYSYAVYAGKAIWPARLAVFYPHPENSLVWWIVLAAALPIFAISLVAWTCRARRPYLLTGWLWFVVAMVPMIGLVQVGRQAMADRYAYLPFVGLFIAVVWGCAELFQRLHLSAAIQTAMAGAALVGYASVTVLQVHYWHDSYALFSHTLQVTSRNGIAEDNLGEALMEMGRLDLALPHFEAAAEYIPELSTAHYNLAVVEQRRNHTDLAKREYELALKFSSDPTELAQTHSNLGFLLLDVNDPKAAVEQFSAALQLIPDKPNSLLGRGIAEYRRASLDAALADLSRAAQLAPVAQADFWLGRALEDKGQTEAARTAYAAALRLAPGMSEAQQRLAALRAEH